MKVVCVNVGNYQYLTEGKVYPVLRAADGAYYLINDDGWECDYPRGLFEEIEEDKYAHVSEAIADLVEYRYKPEVF
jgi:hypothetical protein